MTQHNSEQDTRNYEDMSRDELVALIGFDVDANTSREDLVTMARDADSRRR